MENEHIFSRHFLQTMAIKDGHYEFAGQKHSRYHIDFGTVIQEPDAAAKIAKQLYIPFKTSPVTVVMTPNAAEGMVLAHLVAAKFAARCIRASRRDGVVELAPHIELRRSDTVLIVDDGINTGNSVRQSVALARDSGARCCGVSVCIIRDRSVLPEIGVTTNYIFDLSEWYPLVSKKECDQCRQFDEISARLNCETDAALQNALIKRKYMLQIRSAYSS